MVISLNTRSQNSHVLRSNPPIFSIVEDCLQCYTAHKCFNTNVTHGRFFFKLHSPERLFVGVQSTILSSTKHDHHLIGTSCRRCTVAIFQKNFYINIFRPLCTSHRIVLLPLCFPVQILEGRGASVNYTESSLTAARHCAGLKRLGMSLRVDEATYPTRHPSTPVVFSLKPLPRGRSISPSVSSVVCCPCNYVIARRYSLLFPCFTLITCQGNGAENRERYFAIHAE